MRKRTLALYERLLRIYEGNFRAVFQVMTPQKYKPYLFEKKKQLKIRHRESLKVGDHFVNGITIQIKFKNSYKS